MLKTKKTLIVLLINIVVTAAFAQKIQTGITAEEKSKLYLKMSGMEIPFILNRGQMNSEVKFYAGTFFGTVFVTKKGEIIYSFPKFESDSEPAFNEDNGYKGRKIMDYCSLFKLPDKRKNFYNKNKPKFKGLSLREEFLNGKDIFPEGTQENAGKINLFKGNKPGNWKYGIPAYSTVDLKEVYDNIFVELKAYGNNLEKIIYVKPGGNPENIKIRINGVEKLKVDMFGELEINTKIGCINYTSPVAYQEYSGTKKYVDVAYSVNQNEYGFTLGEYDKNRPLVIDPLVASTLLGGVSLDGVSSIVPNVYIALDTNGDVFVAGGTYSSDFPVSAGVVDEDHNYNEDAFITKFNSDLSQIIASTFFGGNADDVKRGGPRIMLDGTGNVFIVSQTTSSNFPVTAGAYDETYNGNEDIYISKFSNDLSQLLSSSFIGTSGYDQACSMVFDSDDNLFIAGHTRSSGFPTTSGAYDRTFNGLGTQIWGGDIIVAKFSNDLSSLMASTFLGGSEWDDGGYITVDNDDNVFVTGTTKSSNFPTTANVFDKTYNGAGYGGDIFLSKLNNDLSGLLASTYLGGNDNDWGYAVAVNQSGSVYLSGHIPSPDFPTTSGAYKEEYNGIGGADTGDDSFVSKFDNDLTTLEASTFLGGTGWENGNSLAIDNEGHIYVSGNTNSNDFPVSENAFQNSNKGGGFAWGGEIFLSKMDAGLTTLIASTYFGGSNNEMVSHMVMDTEGNIYFAGYTQSSDFPVTSNAYDNTYNGGDSDAFVSKIEGNLADSTQSDIKDENESIPDDFILYQNYPNPFNPETTIMFKIPEKQYVNLNVYNIKGQLVRSLLSDQLPSGFYEIKWDGTVKSGRKVSSGIYIYQLKTEKFIFSRKMLMMK